MAALEASGALPRPVRTAALAGTDANANGVRDDLDAHIQAKYPEAKQQRAAKQFAAVIQAAVLVNAADASAVKSLSVRSPRAVPARARAAASTPVSRVRPGVAPASGR